MRSRRTERVVRKAPTWAHITLYYLLRGVGRSYFPTVRLARLAFVTVGVALMAVGFAKTRGLLEGRPTGDELMWSLVPLAGAGLFLWFVSEWRWLPRWVRLVALGATFITSFVLTTRGIEQFIR